MWNNADPVSSVMPAPSSTPSWLTPTMANGTGPMAASVDRHLEVVIGHRRHNRRCTDSDRDWLTGEGIQRRVAVEVVACQ